MTWLVALAWADGDCGAWGEPVERGNLTGHEEVSGLAASRRNPGTLFFHEDDDGEPVLVRHGGGPDTEHAIPVEGLDWEDVGIGPCPTGIDACDCVCLGDIGDNLQDRTSLQLVWFPEPATGQAIEPTVWEVTWPDHPRDAEAMLVDLDGTVYIVAKFESAVGVATGPGPLEVLPGPDVGGDEKIIAGSVSPNGRRVMLRTDDHVWLYEGDDVRSALAAAPVSLPEPDQKRQEAATFSADGRSVFLTGEGVDPILFEVACVQFTEDDELDPVAECLDEQADEHTKCGCGSSSVAGLLPLLLLWRRRRG